MEVFCKNCKYFEDSYIDLLHYLEPSCNSPKNRYVVFHRTYRDVYKQIKFSNVPKNINSKNNCKSYKRIWWKFWVEDK